MTLVTESWLADSLLLLVLLLWLYNIYLTSAGTYFKAHGILYLKRNPFMSFLEAVSKSQMEQSLSYYKRFHGEKYYGYVQARVPTLLVRDPDLIHRILVKDFMHFQDRNFGVPEGDELVTKNLFHMQGESWKELRNKLIPTFTSGKLKLMFPQFVKCGEHLLEDIEIGIPVEAKGLSTSFSIEVIGSTAFGLSFSKDNPQYAEFISRLSTLFVSGGVRGMLLGIFVHFAPKLLKLFKLSFVTPGAEEYFVNIIRANKEHRKSGNIKRNDYFQLLMSLQEAEETGKSSETAAVTDINEDDVLINQMKYVSQSSSPSRPDLKFFTDKGFAAQAVVFLIGGSESVSGTISFALYHIARDPEIQQQVICEVDTVLAKHHGSWSYEALKELVYLDQVIQGLY
ncbi:hypothetical protein J6590_050983 [Homalodisca vitripennis]|nr:hypothetical protein J6590_050983 [Homalodisca vitripennis]